MATVAEVLSRRSLVACASCRYCMPCPFGLDIPSLIRFWNVVKLERIADGAEIRRRYGATVSDRRRGADRCINCGKCLVSCPRAIEIDSVMDDIAALVEAAR